jgi:hypothetical protein
MKPCHALRIWMDTAHMGYTPSGVDWNPSHYVRRKDIIWTLGASYMAKMLTGSRSPVKNPVVHVVKLINTQLNRRWISPMVGTLAEQASRTDMRLTFAHYELLHCAYQSLCSQAILFSIFVKQSAIRG